MSHFSQALAVNFLQQRPEVLQASIPLGAKSNNNEVCVLFCRDFLSEILVGGALSCVRKKSATEIGDVRLHTIGFGSKK